MADAGEFTLRLLNGKLDLSQAEAVADLISSTMKLATKLRCSKCVVVLVMKLLN
jgi:tRNA U34 5-carboxymethylaminomethyl modifying GTPase MnmE/TrmE